MKRLDPVELLGAAMADYRYANNTPHHCEQALRRAQTQALLAIAQLLIDERSEYDHRYEEGYD